MLSDVLGVAKQILFHDFPGGITVHDERLARSAALLSRDVICMLDP
jgi:hypothetical protein